MWRALIGIGVLATVLMAIYNKLVIVQESKVSS